MHALGHGGGGCPYVTRVDHRGQGCQVQQFLNPKLVKLVGPNFITVGPTIADCGYFTQSYMVNCTVFYPI